MSRIVFWILLIGLVVFAIRAKLKGLSARQQPPLDAQPRRQPPPAEIETMTQCAHCGIHFPASEAVHADGHDYCSPGHVRLPPR
ncbi:PP0621 family protein [Massilia sp. BSC265]|uniref:PP0621 family protein n=1 Tax=Massilia sp. BSC265 TaxID=1549812 RepID=UPI0004E96978|nr:PP0621 family protein [Massilia sp. BSC265]KFI05878.1 membrane protein [Massilia sp. BSC265]